MTFIVTGATGTAGSEVIRQAILNPEVTGVTALVRKPLDVQHPKLTTIIHQNFLDYSTLSDVFKRHDACIWCLGISQNEVTKDEYFTITHEFTLEAAKAIRKANPGMTFIFLSGGGADSSEKSRILFAKVKGKTENDLTTLGFQRLYHFRPNYIHSTHPTTKKKLQDKIIHPFAPFLYRMIPNIIIDVRELALAMVYTAKHGASKTILENRDIKNVAMNHSS